MIRLNDKQRSDLIRRRTKLENTPAYTDHEQLNIEAQINIINNKLKRGY